jgi:hypothetical protein
VNTIPCRKFDVEDVLYMCVEPSLGGCSLWIM